MRAVASHLLVALAALGVGYTIALALAGWVSDGAPGGGATDRLAGVYGIPDAAPRADGSSEQDPCEPCRRDLERLEARNVALSRQLRLAEESRALAEGIPLAPPADLEDRFKEAAVVQAFRYAARDAEFDVEIASVDCTEYPCIIYGHTVDDEGTLEAFLDAATNDLYKEGATRVHYSWGRTRIPDSAELRRYFGVVLYPESDALRRGEQIQRQLRFRSQQMWEAVRGEVR